MRCPQCAHPDTKVTDSRESGEGIRRRRECLLCGLRFTTMERIQANALTVIKRDGSHEEFSREKVRNGVLRACTRRPVTVDAIDRLVEGVERDLQRLGRGEVPSTLIGQLVMERLRALDRVAYVRFASVYRNFQDVDGFIKEAQALLSDGAAPVSASGGQGRRAAHGAAVAGAAPPEAQLPLPLNGNGHRPPRRARKKDPETL